MNKQKIKIAEKIILCGEIQNLTPLIIGSGKNDHCDIDILLDYKGIPFIPATSFLGVLRHAFTQKDSILKDEFDKFWGNSYEKESFQSSIRCSDLYPFSNKFKIKIRDGVKIDNARGIAEDKGKYNFQILEPGKWFKLRLEISVKENQKEYFEKMALCLKSILESGDFSVGARTQNGFGRLKGHNIKIMVYDFNKSSNIFKWLNNENIKDTTHELDQKYPKASKLFISKINFIVNAKFILKTSLLINSGSNENFNASHIKSINISKGKKEQQEVFALPGTSVKGVIRARAEKIVQTLSQNVLVENNCEHTQESNIIKKLFGFVDTDKSNSNQTLSKRSKVIVQEKYLQEFKSYEQHRIKVDRFTGGAINGALFSSLPIGHNKKHENFKKDYIELSLKINKCKDYEAGLILLVLKDLWVGDCTLGSGKAIGRGVLKGIKADISFNNDEIFIRDKFDNLEFGNKNTKLTTKNDLQEFINKLCNKCQNTKKDTSSKEVKNEI